MAYTLAPFLKQRFFDDNGDPLAGGFLYSYQANTTTPQDTYVSSSGAANTNPVELDADGYANVWLDPTLSYKFILKDSALATIYTVDNVIGILTADAVTTASLQDDAVTQAKIGDDAVGADQLQDHASTDGSRAVTTNHIRNDAIIAMKMADAIVTKPVNYSITATPAANALTIALKTAAGSDATATTAIKIPFRHATAATGTPVVRSVTGALSTVISSGSTAGHANASTDHLYVYALDNAGTVALGWSTTLFDEGSVVTTVAEGGAGGADLRTAMYSTAQLTGVALKLLARMKTSQATAGTWVTAMAEIALDPGYRTPTVQSSVYLDTPNGHGATNTKIRRWTNSTTVGTDLTYSDNSANTAMTITVNVPGLYSMSYWDRNNVTTVYSMGISLNSSQLTTSILSITAADRIALVKSVGPELMFTSAVRWLKAGDILRCHTDANVVENTDIAQFYMVRIL